MFDLVVSGPRGAAGRSAGSLAISWAVHLVAIAAVASAYIFATDQIPPVSDTIAAFVVEAPAPPPPPPAPPPPAARTPAPKPSPRQEPRPTVPVIAQAAPIEAPSAVVPDFAEEFGVPDGVVGGVPGGVPGGIVGGVIGGLPDAPPPPPPPAPNTPIRTGGQIQAPALVKRVPPVYPPLAVSAGVEGVVILEATVGRDGRVEEVSVLRSVPLLDRAAMEAVRQWQYEPLRLNGRAERFILTVTVSFSLT